MIDEKKIQEAANAYVGHAKEYDEGLRVSGERASFADGAMWMQQEFLKDLWHDVEEVPNEAKSNLLVQFKDGHFYIIDTHRMLENTNWNAVNDMWNEYNKFAEARRYLYIDDLLSKKGGAG